MKVVRKVGQRGSIKWILLIVIALIVASYFFDFSIQEVIEHEQTQSNYEYIKNHLHNFYNLYLKQIVEFFWGTVVVDLLWGNMVEFLNNTSAGEFSVTNKIEQATSN